MKTTDRVLKLLSITGRLSDLVRRENEILASRTSRGLKELIEEKHSLGTVYEQHIQVLREDDAMAKVEQSLRKRLSETLSAFTKLLGENKIRIEANLEAGRQVFEIIAEAAKEHVSKGGVYGDSGVVKPGPSGSYAPALSVGLNHEL